MVAGHYARYRLGACSRNPVQVGFFPSTGHPMKINNKGQVTIPQAVRQLAGLHPQVEVEIEVRGPGEVVLRRAMRTAPQSLKGLRAALERVRGSANATD